MLNLFGIVVAILKMATGRKFPMSGINSGHHNLPTYEMALSSKFDMWVDNDVPN
jgi:5-carboxymethyl-2-hydroxymuconate isomerase